MPFKVMFVSSKDKKRKFTATEAFGQTNFGFAVFFVVCNIHIVGLKAYFLGVAPILLSLLPKDRTALQLHNKLSFFICWKIKV